MIKALLRVCPAVMMLCGLTLGAEAAPIHTIKMFSVWASVDGHSSSLTLPGKVRNNRKVFFDYSYYSEVEDYWDEDGRDFFLFSTKNISVKGYGWIYNDGTPWAYTKIDKLSLIDFSEYYDSEESYELRDYSFTVMKKSRLIADLNWNWDNYDEGTIKRETQITGDYWKWVNGGYVFVPGNFKVSAVNARLAASAFMPSVPLPPSIVMLISGLGLTTALGLSRLRPS